MLVLNWKVFARFPIFFLFFTATFSPFFSQPKSLWDYRHEFIKIEMHFWSWKKIFKVSEVRKLFMKLIFWKIPQKWRQLQKLRIFFYFQRRLSPKITFSLTEQLQKGPLTAYSPPPPPNGLTFFTRYQTLSYVQFVRTPLH